MSKLTELSAPKCALLTLQNHSVNGSFRDEADLNIAKYHANLTIDFLIDYLSNVEGSIEDKILFLKEVKEEIPKFSGKK
jgi:hypothetical protein